MPCRYVGLFDNATIPTKASLAHAEGVTGKSVKVGIIDMVRNANSSLFDLEAEDAAMTAAFADRIDFYQDFINSKPDRTGSSHGADVAYTLLGAPMERESAGLGLIDDSISGIIAFNGGVAPDARLYWGANCNADGCSTADINPKVLAEQGVRLFNLSQAINRVTGEGDPYVIASGYYARAFAQTLAHDPLIVVSAGNVKNAREPSLSSHVPRLFPQHAPHWLVVTGIAMDADGHPVERDATGAFASDGSNCGSMLHWCLAAPAQVASPFQGLGNLSPTTWGTSFSAPIVTGTAALVWDAYPWMSASNVQQTVLTTATDLGEPGVDSVFGWGLVNARNAIDGPAQFVRNDHVDGFTAEVEGDSRPFFHDISGDGGLLKRGSGRLTLSGQNTYTGGTLVEAGTLQVLGALGSDVTVAPGGTFATGGAGVRIDGNYRALSSAGWNRERPESEWATGMATTAIQLGAPLQVTGTADVGNHETRLLLLPEADGYIVQATQTLITTGNGLSGRFAEVVHGSGFFWNARLDYGSHQLTAEITRAKAEVQAMSLGAPERVVNGAGMADTLIAHTDHLVASGQTAGHEAVLADTARLLSAGNDEMAALSLSSLTGEIHTTARTLGTRRVFHAGEQLAMHLSGLDSRSDTGVWVQDSHRNGQVNRMGDGQAEVSHSAFGIGMDERLGERWTVGLLAASTRSNAHLDTLGGRLTGKGQQMALYARRDLGAHGYWSGFVSHDRHRLETRRQVLAGEMLNTVIGQHTDTITLVRLESGIRLGEGVTPYLALGALSHRQGGFRETGVLGLIARGNTMNAAFVDLGVRLDRHLGRWTLAGLASTRQRLRTGANGVTAAFTGAESAAFTLPGQPFPRTSVRVGNDLEYRSEKGVRVRFGWGAEHDQGLGHHFWGEAALKAGF